MTAHRFLSSWVLGLMLGVAQHEVAAQGFKDPTQPPPAFAPRSAGVVSEVEVVGEPPAVSLLLVGRNRQVALIGNELLAPGGTGGKGKLIRVTIREAVLQSPQGTLSLGMYPGISKTYPQPRAARPAENLPNNRKAKKP